VVREKAKRRLALLTMAPLPPPANGKLEILMNGPAAAAGNDVRKN
jgi:hypothetical protein